MKIAKLARVEAAREHELIVACGIVDHSAEKGLDRKSVV